MWKIVDGRRVPVMMSEAIGFPALPRRIPISLAGWALRFLQPRASFNVHIIDIKSTDVVVVWLIE
jgi:hypothetical protein